MTGNLLITAPKAEAAPHTRLVIRLDGDKELRFVDPRRLGVLYVVRDMEFQEIPGLQRMGPEPLSGDFTFEVFNARLHNRTAKIKSLLMDQHFIAGIGNIYGDEILFQSRIKPSRKACDLTGEEIRRLYDKIRYVLKNACEHNADLSGMHNWFVHGRSKGYCVNCKAKLKRVRVQGRYSYYCARCQK